MRAVLFVDIRNRDNAKILVPELEAVWELPQAGCEVADLLKRLEAKSK